METTLASAAARATAAADRSARRARNTPAASALAAIALGNVGTIVWLWYHGGNVTALHSQGELLSSIARITGLLGAYGALLQVILLARLRPLECIVGFDRLTVWHR